MDKSKNYFLTAIFAGALYLGTAQTSFGNLIMDGTFASFSTTPPTNGGELGYNATLTDWSSTGYNFVFTNGNRGDRVIQSSYGNFSLWGPRNGSFNGLTTPPGGGNIIASDGAFTVGPISQLVTGLTVGATYAVSFEWAGAQQYTFTGTQTESWSVALGGAGFTPNSGDTGGTLAGAQNTGAASNASEGFTGWMSQTLDFTATSTSEELYFLSVDTPTGVPPFSLLADVSLTEVPETRASACWTLLFAMLIIAGNRAWRGYQKRSLTNT